MNRILVIDKCHDCNYCNSPVGKILICNHPDFKLRKEYSIFFGTRIHPDCPLPQGNYAVSQYSFQEIMYDLETPMRSQKFTRETMRNAIERYKAMFHPIPEVGK